MVKEVDMNDVRSMKFIQEELWVLCRDLAQIGPREGFQKSGVF